MYIYTVLLTWQPLQPRVHKLEVGVQPRPARSVLAYSDLSARAWTNERGVLRSRDPLSTNHSSPSRPVTLSLCSLGSLAPAPSLSAWLCCTLSCSRRPAEVTTTWAHLRMAARVTVPSRKGDSPMWISWEYVLIMDGIVS